MKNKSAWEKVEIARDANRPTAMDYIDCIFDDFMELHGDRSFKDDKAIVCGLGKINNQNFTLIAEQKGRNTKENIERNFGMPNPESYKKAIRFMKQAEKFNRPIITFIDTKGAFPGIGAEERCQGEAIASSMFEMAKVHVPIISIVIGEGSSGGALAIGVANKIYMLENAIYSILSPEGFSSIIWKDASKAKEAAEKMKLTAQDLYEMKIIDEIIKEPKMEEKQKTEEKPKMEEKQKTKEEPKTEEKTKMEKEESIKEISKDLKQKIIEDIIDFEKLSKEEIKEQRYNKFRKIGSNIIEY